MWQQWVNAILGLWVMLASYLYMGSGTSRVVMLLTGLVVAVLGFWGAASEGSESGGRHSMQN